MIKWFVYIVFLLVSAPSLLSAKVKNSPYEHAIITKHNVVFSETIINGISDTIKVLKSSSKPDTKVKEVAKAKKQPKPEKVDEKADAKKDKPKRQRRPDGMERPPEIPRRNDN